MTSVRSRPHKISLFMKKNQSKMALEDVLAQICSLKKLDRDKGINDLRTLINGSKEKDDLFKRLEPHLLAVLKKNERWESTQGCLAATCALVEHATEQFSEDILSLLPTMLEDKEPRVRQAAGEVAGQLCKWRGRDVYSRVERLVVAGIRRNLKRDEELLQTQQAQPLVQKLIPVPELTTGVDAASVFHESAGWKGLETYMYALQQAVEGGGALAGAGAGELLDLLFMALKHPNRFVREMGFRTLAVVVCVAMGDSPGVHPAEVHAYWPAVAKHLAEGLADNWSQVRMASSVALRQFLLHLDEGQAREEHFAVLLPAMCLNRHYVAEGVRLYSQETWRLVMGTKGVQQAERCIKQVVQFYVLQTLADNHAVREAACTCVAELGRKVDRGVLQPFVLELMQALLVCFQDDSWPVRDAACLATGSFVACYPDECRPVRGQVVDLLLRNLEDSIASVRQGGALALAQVIGAYPGEEDDLQRVVEEARRRLQGVADQPADDELKHPGIDPSPAVFGVVKRAKDNDADAHTDQTMYSCGSLAPRMKRGGGCTDHTFQKPSQPWEKGEGCVHLVRELSALKEAAPHLDVLLLLVAKAAEHRHYVQHHSFLESVFKQMPSIARNMGKRKFKCHLAAFLDPLFYALKSDNALAQSAAVDSVLQLSTLLGRMIFRGRVEQHNPAYLQALDHVYASASQQ